LYFVWYIHKTCQWEERNTYSFWGLKPALGKPMRLWEDNIRISLKAIGWEDVDFSYPAEVERSGRLL